MEWSPEKAPLSLSHYLEVCVPPSVVAVKTEGGGFVDVKEGDNATLECEADGIPRPHIHWVRLYRISRIPRERCPSMRHRRTTEHWPILFSIQEIFFCLHFCLLLTVCFQSPLLFASIHSIIYFCLQLLDIYWHHTICLH